MGACSLMYIYIYIYIFVPQGTKGVLGSITRFSPHRSTLEIQHTFCLYLSLSFFFSLFRFSRYKVNRSTLARYSRNASLSPSSFQIRRDEGTRCVYIYIYIINIYRSIPFLLLSSLLFSIDRCTNTRAATLSLFFFFLFFSFPPLRFLSILCTRVVR